MPMEKGFGMGHILHQPFKQEGGTFTLTDKNVRSLNGNPLGDALQYDGRTNTQVKALSETAHGHVQVAIGRVHHGRAEAIFLGADEDRERCAEVHIGW